MTIRPYKFLLPIVLVFAFACNREKTLFQQMPPEETGIHFSNRIIEDDTFNILEYEYVYNGGGVAIADFNKDGLSDVYFTGNMVPNQLYLNKGNFRFEDITEVAGVKGEGRWNSGVAVVDINADGWPDLYVCATAYEPGYRRANLLYVNQGLNKDNRPTFKELGEPYGIADTSHTTNAAFFDYDNDGDLDLFLAINQMDAKHTPNHYRKKITDGTSIRRDKLFRNDFDELKGHPVFTDVSLEAGINIEGFSLGLNIVDINRDGWKDIYVTNDYLSNDLFYINNGDGTFTDQAESLLKHTSYSAMGNDVADLNNDGLADIIALDMLPEDNFRRKTMLPPNNYTPYINNERYGYQHQYARNTLQLNQGQQLNGQGHIFSEIAMMAGISATDWSWTPLVADFDNDGDRDLIVTNGFPKDVTDRDFFDYNNEKGRYLSKEKLMEKIPSVKIPNYAFRNELISAKSQSINAIPTFEKVNTAWGMTQPSFSNGAAFADLDNDGDLDYLVNNINDSAFVFKNTQIETHPEMANWLKIQFKGSEKNPEGFGVIATLFYQNGQQQIGELTPYRGYLSSVENHLHFGLGAITQVDSILIQWQEGRQQLIKQVSVNQILKVDFQDASIDQEIASPKLASSIFSELDPQLLGIDFRHPEWDFIDFNVQRLLLHKLSQFGPGMAIADINGDDLDDFYIGGSYQYKGKFFMQNPDGTFEAQDLLPGEGGKSKREEELGVLFFDADNDGDEDLYLVSGGYGFEISDTTYQDRLFFNKNGRFEASPDALPAFLSSGSCVKAADFDRDNDLDLFVGGRVMPNKYPEAVSSYILQNDGKGHFTIANKGVAPQLEKLGMVCDALWTDYDNDGWTDLLLAGEWMPLSLFKNEEGQLKLMDLGPVSDQYGWWNSLAAADFDLDGDMDYIAGNLGLNTLLRANDQQPIAIYGADFDNNGGYDAIPSAWFPDKTGQAQEFPFFGRIDMEKQMIKIKKSYLHHYQFGETSMDAVLMQFPGVEPLKLKANYLKTSYLENLGNGSFALHSLPDAAQVAPVYGILCGDFNQDNFPDILLAGNDYGTEVSMGRYDAFNGLLLLGDGKGQFSTTTIQQSGIAIAGDGKSLVRLEQADGNTLIIAGQNQSALRVFSPSGNEEKVISLQTMDCSAIVYLEDRRSYKEELPYGNSFLSQSARKLWLPGSVEKVEVIDYQGAKRVVKTFQNKADQTSLTNFHKKE